MKKSSRQKTMQVILIFILAMFVLGIIGTVLAQLKIL